MVCQTGKTDEGKDNMRAYIMFMLMPVGSYVECVFFFGIACAVFGKRGILG